VPEKRRKLAIAGCHEMEAPGVAQRPESGRVAVVDGVVQTQPRSPMPDGICAASWNA
jgi:hypothetical protein